jgi:hypothetical protein
MSEIERNETGKDIDFVIEDKPIYFVFVNGGAMDVIKEVLSLKRRHRYCEDSWYSCPMAEGGCADDDAGDKCNCGAEEYNAKIDEIVEELRIRFAVVV